MDDARLRTLVARLDDLVPRAGAAIIEDHGLYGSQFDPAFTGNRLGYLRLGIELLKVADASPARAHPDRVFVDLTYLGFSRLPLEAFERREDPTPRPESVARGAPGIQDTPLRAVGVVVVGLLLVGLLVAVVHGLDEMLRWLVARF